MSTINFLNLKNAVITILLLLVCLQATAQFGEKELEVKNLTHLAKIWGFLKYHHPEIKECKIDWDNALINTLSQLNASPQSEYHTIVESLINVAGEVEKQSGIKPSIITDEVLNNLEFDWIESAHLSSSIQDKLKNILEQSRRKEHCLFSPVFTSGNLEFDSEKPYTYLGVFPHINYRILAVFRYWNVINYYFPYKHIMDQDWNSTLEQFILPITYSTNQEEYHLRFKEFTTYINDSHSFFISTPYYNWRGGEPAPFQVKLIEEQTVIVDVAESITGVEVGDVIISIDDETIEERRLFLRKYTAGSNETTIERNINNSLILGKKGDFELTLRKANGEIVTLKNLYRSYNEYVDFHFNENGSSWNIMNTEACGQVGYVNMGLLEEKEIEAMIGDLWDMEAIIFDIRNYPKGTLWPLVHYLFNEPISIADFTTPNDLYAGQFYWKEISLGSYNTNSIYKGKLIILFNEETQSQAEYTIMGLENHPNSIKIGSQTAGADGNVSTIKLPGGIEVYFTGLGTYYPDGTPTQRIGIVPDIEVQPTIEGLRSGRDEVLETALDCNLLDTTTSTLEENSENGVEIFPNPFRSTLEINNQESDAVEILIYNTLGHLVLERQIRDIASIDVSNLNAGMYFIYWKKEKEKSYFSKKLVKH